MNKTVKRLTNIGSSPLYIISAICLLLSALAAGFKIFTEPLYISNSLSAIFPDIGLSYGFYQKWSFVPVLFKALIDALLSIGMIGIFIMMCSKKAASLGFGAGLVKALAVIETIFAYALLLLLIALEFGNVFPYLAKLIESGETIPQNELITCICCLVVAVVGIILMSLYVRKVFVTADAVNKTLKAGVIMGKVSVYIIVHNFLIFFTCIAALVYMFITDGGEYIMKLSVLLLSLSHLFSNINLVSMRSEMLYIKARGFTS